MDKTYKFTFELTEEQVREMDEAIRDKQLKYYADQADSTEVEERAEELRKFMVVDDILNQFNEQVINYNLQ